jgi:ribosomal-protein-alanine N-acetyltransferase
VRGPRLCLRDFRLDDGPAVHAYASDPEVTRFLAWGPQQWDATEAFVRGAAGAWPVRSQYELAACLEDGSLVGAGGLRLRDLANRSGDIGYVLRRDAWGYGYGTEVAHLLLHLAFGRFGLHRVWATCDVDNGASARVLEKVGMRLEGRLRDYLWVRGSWRDHLLYAVLEQEWRPQPGMTLL